jgi:hypothetical protein
VITTVRRVLCPGCGAAVTPTTDRVKHRPDIAVVRRHTIPGGDVDCPTTHAVRSELHLEP